MTKALLEELYLLSFIDLTNVHREKFASLMASYRDVALLKALYWRMHHVFRWIVNGC